MDDPFDHLALSLSAGEYRARTRMGTETIAVLGLNRGVLITPFHNMALMCPATTTAQVDRHTEAFDVALKELCA